MKQTECLSPAFRELLAETRVLWAGRMVVDKDIGSLCEARFEHNKQHLPILVCDRKEVYLEVQG